ncbi:cold-shock protein [Streptomyces sp. NPDC017202]|uniref:cold-shock protein n=1 Tax=Streptomyces sp. NPDC017202 TaxID=3364981 RepID=UPI0037B22255
MATGTVKWFNTARGFGFIEQDGGGTDVYAHYSYITDHGLVGLLAGQRVTFDAVYGRKCPYAENIVT